METPHPANADAPAGDAAEGTESIDESKPEGGKENGDAKDRHRAFGTFGGVFTPTLLTILGVIMYLRVGWVVGNAGIVGGALIIGLSFGIATLTALSMASITTNIRIGAGGAYAIITQALGLEVGGAVGIPRYLSQALAVAMYVFGFREGWLAFFPEHPAFLVDLIVLLSLFGIAYLSADLAIKTEYVIMALIAGSLVSVGIAAATGSMQYEATQVGWWGSFAGSPENDFSGTDFWLVFAVFFPASTGIMAGANLSGDLADPRRAIPVGTMAAIGVSLVVYLLLAYWLARSATPEELVSNYYVMVDKAFWGPVVVAGLLGACFSSALASIVGAARILQAMGNHGIVPASEKMAKLTKKGEPRNAMLVTGAIVFAALLLRDLNALTPLITLFFLITYLMLNVVLWIEQRLGLASFRPLWRVPRWVPIVGTLGCVVVMFIVNPVFSVVSIVVTVGFYVLLVRRHMNAPFEDVRSGLFVSLAEWAAQKVRQLPDMQERAWKPNLLVPAEDVRALRGEFSILQNIASPRGSVKLVGLSTKQDYEELSERIDDLAYAFRERGVFTSWTVVQAGAFASRDATDEEAPDEAFANGLIATMQTLRGTFFRPNIVFLPMPGSETRGRSYARVIQEADREAMGVLLHAPHEMAGLARRERINVWIHDRSPDWQMKRDIGNLNLSVLIAYKLKANWNARLRFITVVEDKDEMDAARAFLEQLVDLGRMPDARVMVAAGGFEEYLGRAPQADLNIFGLEEEPDFDFVRRMRETTRATCLFVRDSGMESALA